jgi:hypothetical protein
MSFADDESTSSSSSLGFKQLDDTNYSIWVQRMTQTLAKKKYWRYAEGTLPKPTFDSSLVFADTDVGKAARVAATKTFQKEVSEWEDNDRAAWALICSGLSDPQLHHVEKCTTAHDTWRTICNAHEKQGLNYAVAHFIKMLTTKLAEGGKVQDHLTAIKTHYDRTVAANKTVTVSEGALAIILMMSFPLSYEPLKMTLSSLKDDELTFANISRAMLNEEARRSTSATMPLAVGSASDQSALAMYRPQQQQQQQQQQQRQQGGKQKVAIPCDWCGLNNHQEADCHKKQNGQPQRTPAERQDALRDFQNRRTRNHRDGGRSRKGKQEASFADLSDGDGNSWIAISSPDEPEPTQHIAASLTRVVARLDKPTHSVSLHGDGPGRRADPTATEWYIDSGASYHYCRHREWFDEFAHITGQSVSMGDGGRVPILGRGTIHGHALVSATTTTSMADVR